METLPIVLTLFGLLCLLSAMSWSLHRIAEALERALERERDEAK